MPVPEFFHFIRPALDAVAASPGAHWREHLKPVASKLNLNNEDWLDLTPKGNKPRVEDRMEWALAYLRAAKLIENTRRGHNQLTDRGREFLKSAPETIKPNDLEVFPEFVAFYRGSATPDSIQTSSEPIEVSRTPFERIEDAYHEIRSALASEVLEHLLRTHPGQFERIIVDLMLKMGYGGSDDEAGQVVGRVGDGGIDGIIRQDRLGLDNIYLQAKRWKDPVGTSEINGFIGALSTRGASKGVIITTSTFTPAAKAIAAGAPHLKLSLIDGVELAHLMIEHDLGVAIERPLALKRLDSGYFADE